MSRREMCGVCGSVYRDRPRAGRSVAKHEQEYKTVTDKSIFVKMKVRETSNEFLVIWTTTPWTIPFNLAIMVNPDLDYLKLNFQIITISDMASAIV